MRVRDEAGLIFQLRKAKEKKFRALRKVEGDPAQLLAVQRLERVVCEVDAVGATRFHAAANELSRVVGPMSFALGGPFAYPWGAFQVQKEKMSRFLDPPSQSPHRAEIHSARLTHAHHGS